VPTIVHVCFGLRRGGARAQASGYSFLPQLADSTAAQISIEAAQPKLDLGILADLAGKTIVLASSTSATRRSKSPEQVAQRIATR